MRQVEIGPMIAFIACWLAISIILGGFLARLAHLAKLRDQRAADGVNGVMTA